MLGFSIDFSNPWWLLLLIPAFAFTLIPYFRLSKRYRRTRNRITSIVLHLLVMTLTISLMAGITFKYIEPNKENEIILLVDVSDTEEQSQKERDEFVETVLKKGKYNNYNIGVVTFGFDQKYAVPLTDDIESIYDLYVSADKPDTSATNIAAALDYAKTLFTNPEVGKIVLITDGKETDGAAKLAIRSAATQGLMIDIANIKSSYDGNDVQIIGVEMPNYYVAKGESCTISVTLQSRGENSVSVGMYDDDQLVAETEDEVTFSDGNTTKIVSFTHTFETEGLHKLNFAATVDDDLLGQNNVYTSYYYLDIFNNVLIIQKETGESDALKTMLNDVDEASEPFNFTEATVGVTVFPETLNAMLSYVRGFDQVILNNISNDDLKKYQFIDEKESDEDTKTYVYLGEVLRRYVMDFGGGVFTVGGTSDKAGAVDAYNSKDMSGSAYQEFLPVNVKEYTPPVAFELVVDRSGSMSETGDDGEIFLDDAKAAAVALLEGLEPKDYMGIMTLDTSYEEILPLTPGSQYDVIKEGITNIGDPTGGTNFSSAIQKAAQKLWDKKDVAKRHIIIITDGLPGDTIANYGPIIEKSYANFGVTLSVLLIGSPTDSIKEEMWEAVNSVGDHVPQEKKGQVYIASTAAGAVEAIMKDMEAPNITDVNEAVFYPVINNMTSPLVQGIDRKDGNKMTVTLGGFYGVEARQSADVVLLGEYNVPIYAQWKYGKGSVGSFMCDLQSTDWSQEFMDDENGAQFIRNAVNNLMPTENIRTKDITLKLVEDNYTNTLNISADLAEGETIKGKISYSINGIDYTVALDTIDQNGTNSDCYVTEPISIANKYSRCGFVAKKGVTYTIEIVKVKTDGTEVAVTMYKTFSYSEEYDLQELETADTLKDKLLGWADIGNGSMIEDLEDPEEVFEDFITALVRTFDPRFLFMILAIVAFLLDIAVRKFKFKWPHEIIRDYKNRKSSK